MAHPGRTLIVAESLGRRETVGEYLAEYGVKPQPVAGYREFIAADAPLMISAAPLITTRERILAEASAQPRTRGLPTCLLVTNVPTTPTLGRNRETARSLP